VTDHDNWLATDTAREAETVRYEAWVESLPMLMPDEWFDTVDAEEEYQAWCAEERDEQARAQATDDGPSDDQIRADEMEVDG
jgi:hypothetical protein